MREYLQDKKYEKMTFNFSNAAILTNSIIHSENFASPKNALFYELGTLLWQNPSEAPPLSYIHKPLLTLICSTRYE